MLVSAAIFAFHPHYICPGRWLPGMHSNHIIDRLWTLLNLLISQSR
jgi:hypothetical protein